MKGLRSLLRLDEKLAAEGRRLRNLGTDTSRWGALTLLAAAAILHGAVLMLPTLRVNATLPSPSPAPNFPRVWRFVPAPPPAPAPKRAPAPDAIPEERRGAPPAAPAPQRPTAAFVARPISLEPILEPLPEIATTVIIFGRTRSTAPSTAPKHACRR